MDANVMPVAMRSSALSLALAVALAACAASEVPQGAAVRDGALAAAPQTALPPAAPASSPTAVPKTAAPVLQRVSLDTRLLFDFDSSELRAAGRASLQKIAFDLHGASIDSVSTTGHADRIAARGYNQQLSEERAGAVKAYLAQLGLDANLIRVEGRGELQPVTGNKCAGMGSESRSNAELVACLQPDRRVEVEVRGRAPGSRAG